MATTAVQPVTPGPLARITDALSVQMPSIAKLLPPDIDLEQFRAATWLEMRQQYGLAECSPESVVTAVIKAATYGMLPGRDCHLLPFANARRGGKKDATFVPNYAGVVLSLERSGKLRKAFAHPVYEKDVFELDYLTDVYSHKPYIKGPAGALLCFYGCVMLKDGVNHIEVMSLDQINAIRLKAPGQKDGPWNTHYEEMARKTALKRVAKYVRLSPAQVALLEEDDQREHREESESRFRTTVSDVYGERPVMAQVSGAGVAARVIPDMSHGGDDQMQEGPFETPDAVRKTPAPSDMRKTTPQAQTHAPDSPEASAWRRELTAVQGSIQDGELLGDIWQALQDPQTPEDIGESILTRAQAYVAQQGEGE